MVENPSKAKNESQSVDNNKIMLQIKIMYMFRVVSLLLALLSLSYFVGTLFFIVSKYTTHSIDDYTFYNQYGMYDLGDIDNLIRVVYFSFTTLSTIGLGDYNPKSEIERIITIFILLFGVVCFSYIMNQFLAILVEFRKVTEENQDCENLSKWLGLLQHYNQNQPLPKELSLEIEHYFDYYWRNDKNYATSGKSDQRFMSELPKNVRRDIYVDFLFKDFLYLFKTQFTFYKEEYGERMPYTWADNNYQQFMIKFLQHLKPRSYQLNEYIFEAGEEVNEQIYVTAGNYQIGFKIDQKEYYHIKLRAKSVVGGYENMLNLDSKYYYKATSFVESFSLRKLDMKPLMDDYP